MKENEMKENYDKKKVAVALTYDSDEPAPKITASGQGLLADKIIEKAAESDVPVHKDEKLAGTLSKLSIGEFIPPELYNVVAEVLVYVDNMERLKGKLGRDE